MAPGKLLNRNIRPSRVQPDDEDDYDMEAASGSDAPSETGFDEESEDDDNDAEGQDGVEDDEEEGPVDAQLEHVSFGALKQAQDALSRKRKRNDETNPEQDEKLEKIRERLREIKRKKTAEEPESKPKKKTSKKADTKSAQADDNDDQHSDSDSDSAPEEVGATSKHAPMSKSSKYQVSRKRQVVEVPKMKSRDPRFDAMQQRNAHTGNVDKAYGFLQEYQADEIAQLKTAMKETNDPFQKDILKRKIGSMENRIKAKAAKEREQEVLRRHRKEERQKVEGGKNPYYLKKSELKEQALVEKYKNMKGKDREKAIDKKRKKESQKEIKRMPDARRMVG
jgi:ribosomal RNA-processing protein 36